nr:GGDEF domain-containing protein [uncultured Rhodoferax sp.]
MSLDPPTIFFCTTLMSLVNGAILGLIRSDLPDSLRPSATSWWLGTMMLAVGTVLFAIPRVLASPWGLTAANLLIMGGPMYYAFALRQFYGLPAQHRMFLPVLAGGLGIYSFLVIWPHANVRIVIVTLVWLMACWQSTLLLRRQKGSDSSHSRTVLQWIFAFVVLIASLRALFYLSVGLSSYWTIMDDTSATNLLTPLLGGILPVMGTTAYLLLCSERLRRQWEQAASTDYLTGLPNRLTLATMGKRRFADAARTTTAIAVAVLDVDHFKSINDRYGHDAGDAALLQVAGLLKAVCRANELPARQGGEEFAVVLEHQDAAGAVAAAERLRTSIEGLAFQVGDVRVAITVSIGVAVQCASDASFDALLSRADVALYLAKAAGRNRVVLAPDVSSWKAKPPSDKR